MNDDPECKCLCERESNIYDIVSSKTKTRTFLVVVYGRFSVFFVVAFFGGWVLLLGGGGGGGGGEFVRFHLVQMDVWYW